MQKEAEKGMVESKQTDVQIFVVFPCSDVTVVNKQEDVVKVEEEVKIEVVEEEVESATSEEDGSVNKCIV